VYLPDTVTKLYAISLTLTHTWETHSVMMLAKLVVQSIFIFLEYFTMMNGVGALCSSRNSTESSVVAQAQHTKHRKPQG